MSGMKETVMVLCCFTWDKAIGEMKLLLLSGLTGAQGHVAGLKLYPPCPGSNVTQAAHAPSWLVLVAIRPSCSQNANRSSRIVTGGKLRAAKRLPRKSHACSMGLGSGDHPGNPYVQYPHF
ncbi:hypothetical protein TNCV_1142391 [Trichonephila clavipes]|nr:hypothetical protein TNCV_1142391 [Trichonephila clavipes]